jgi:hypothetical protein
LRDRSRNYDQREALAFLEKQISNMLNSIGVLSLSEKCDDVHMWSLYADSHRGVCLRFQVSATTPFFARAQPVHYQADRPILNVIRDERMMQVEKALLTKADFWRYQKEWRIIDHDAGPGVHKFPSVLLDGVIFGAKISERNKHMVLGWLAKRNSPAEIMHAQIDSRQFRLNISTVHFNTPPR